MTLDPMDPMDMAGAEYVASLASPAPQLAAAALRVFRAELQRANEQLQQIRDAAGLPPDFALADLPQAVRAALAAPDMVKALQPLRWNARIFWQCDTCGWRGEGPHLDGLLDDNDESVLCALASPGRARLPRELCPQCWPEPIAVKLARRRVFCASLADVFDNEVEVSWLADLLSLIHRTPDLDWLLLSKRIGNWRARIYAAVDLFEHRMVVSGRGDNHGYAMARNWLAGEAPANVWLGATICNQAEADRDVPKLLAIPAKVRFLSVEPMLGPVSLAPCWLKDGCGFGDDTDAARSSCFRCNSDAGGHHTDRCAWPSARLHWIICGGESGPHARPMHPSWPRSLRDQCAAAGVPFLFKQWGEWAPRGPESMGYPPVDSVPRIRLTNRGENGQDLGAKGGDHCWMQRAGKRAAGRLLDGVEHNGVPEVHHA